ncbi:hypothetical protein GCM10025768_21780 [Microbacterium pseudoresistens]
MQRELTDIGLEKIPTRGEEVGRFTLQPSDLPPDLDPPIQQHELRISFDGRYRCHVSTLVNLFY